MGIIVNCFHIIILLLSSKFDSILFCPFTQYTNSDTLFSCVSGFAFEYFLFRFLFVEQAGVLVYRALAEVSCFVVFQQFEILVRENQDHCYVDESRDRRCDINDSPDKALVVGLYQIDRPQYARQSADCIEDFHDDIFHLAFFFIQMLQNCQIVGEPSAGSRYSEDDHDDCQKDASLSVASSCKCT